MKSESSKGCIAIVVIFICLGISVSTLSFLVDPLGFLAYPIIIGLGLGLAKITEPIWYRRDK